MLSVLQHADTLKLKLDIDWHLAHLSDDAVLLPRLASLASQPKFGALSWHWAPRLYRRDPARFRPFVLRHLTDLARWQDTLGWHHELLPWRDDVARTLEPWFDEIDQANDVPVFRRLYAWRHRKSTGRGLDEHAWRGDLLAQFTRAATRVQRAQVLDKFDLRQTLDEATAQALYAHDPTLAAGFILKKLPSPRLAQTVPFWMALMQQARSHDDTAFRQQVYRRMAPVDLWERDALALCRIVDDPTELNAALEQHHPDSRRQDLGEGLAHIMQARGLDALPYIRAHLREVLSYWGRKGYGALDQLAQARGWVDFRIALVLTCGGPQAYNAALTETLDERAIDRPERLRRLTLLSGVSSAWQAAGWGLARAHALDATLALRLYGDHPELLRTLFRTQIQPTWRETYAALFERAWAANDTEITDHLASRYAIRAAWSNPKEAGAFDPVVERVTDLLVGLKLPAAAFARRAASILTRLPASSIRNHRALMNHNRLARLLFEPTPDAFLADPASVRDLIEATEIHVQSLGYRVLALPGAHAQACEQRDMLTSALLRPLPRGARLHALRALEHAAVDAAAARDVLESARQAFHGPQARGPKEALVGLMGRLVARHPSLVEPGQARLVYRRILRAT